MNLILNCSHHGFLKNSEIKIITIKKIEYRRCVYCKREKDKKYSKTYRNKNKEYYRQKKKEHYNAKPELAMEKQRKYRRRKKAQIAQSVEQLIRNE